MRERRNNGQSRPERRAETIERRVVVGVQWQWLVIVTLLQTECKRSRFLDAAIILRLFVCLRDFKRFNIQLTLMHGFNGKQCKNALEKQTVETGITYRRGIFSKAIRHFFMKYKLTYILHGFMVFEKVIFCEIKSECFYVKQNRWRR